MMASELENRQNSVPELITRLQNSVTPDGVTRAHAVSKSSFVKPLKEMFERPNDAIEGQINITGLKRGYVKNSSVFGKVKGGLRNKQTVVGSDICILGQNDHPDGCDSRGEDRHPKQITGVEDGVVVDSTVAGVVEGGVENEQTIKDSKIISDGSCTEELNFFDLRIKKRDPTTEPDGGSYDNCIIDLRKDKDRQDKGEKSEREQLAQNVKRLQESLQDIQERLMILGGQKEEQGQLAQNVKKLQESRQDMQDRLMILADESAKQARETQRQDKKFQQVIYIREEEMKNDKSELTQSIEQLEKKFQDSQEDIKNKLAILEERMRELEKRDRGRQNERDVSSGNHVRMSSDEAAALVSLAAPAAVVIAPVAVAAAPLVMHVAAVASAPNRESASWDTPVRLCGMVQAVGG
ncbi:uncharacterized protein LOC124122353 [Haliotis rufescens]|uniref:uncharacterized protein LOC124122353 n=1 Tax=Haliotis rufescens TaxID=6454 RepID=UPI00201F5F9A|nr:uncharacterized protein LOC124122353 [Haliotis rufescens]